MAADKPTMKALSAFVDEAYHLENELEMVDFYKKWAADYDHQMLDKLGYSSPASIARILGEQLSDQQSSILDIGCGTGLTCRLLAEKGYSNLDGIDFSADMLSVARERGIYRELIQADVNQPLEIESGRYDGAISSGTFTHGHVGAEPLDEIFRVLKPGGILACTVHQDLWQSMGFEAKFTTLVERDVATSVSLELGSYYTDGPVEGWFCVYRKN